MAVCLRVDPAGLRDDLLEFLRASSCLGLRHGGREIEVYLLNNVSEGHDRSTFFVELPLARKRQQAHAA